MKPTKINEIGSITDKNDNQMVKMWRVDVPSGKRPLQHHSHFNFEIMYVNSGSGIYHTANANYPILPGDMFIFSSNEFHCITDIGNDGLVITNLHFNPQFIWNNTSDSNTHVNFNFCFSHHPDFSNRIISADTSDLSPFFLQIQQELFHKPVEHYLSAKSLLSLLLISLVRNHNYLESQIGMNGEQLHSIQHVLCYIEEHFSEKITLQELSSLAGLTPTYFSTLFKQVVGISLWNYISSKRIDKAIRLITSKESKETMIDIAIECGFNNTANFNKTFKKFTGITPREYKSDGYTEIS